MDPNVPNYSPFPFDLSPDPPRPAPTPAMPPPPAVPIPPPALAPPAFVLHQVIDRQHNGMVVSAFEYPAGWQARSDLRWNYQDISLPVNCHVQVAAPQGAALLEMLPIAAFYWIEPNYGFCQPGQQNMGQICLQPMPPVDTLVKRIIPQVRANRQGLRVVDSGPFPELTRRAGPLPGGQQGQDVRVRIEYMENGRPIEEEFYGSYSLNKVPYYGPMGAMVQVNWGFARLITFREEKGRLDARRDVFWRIAGSVKINPQWEQLYAQITQQLQAQFNLYIQQGYSQIQAAGQLSRAISANNDAMIANMDQQRQAAWHSHTPSGPGHSATDGFDEYIRGVETVNDPYYGTSQQDSNYQYHWTDGSGNYQQSNDPFFNPNVGSNQSWTLMERRGG